MLLEMFLEFGSLPKGPKIERDRGRDTLVYEKYAVKIENDN